MAKNLLVLAFVILAQSAVYAQTAVTPPQQQAIATPAAVQQAQPEAQATDSRGLKKFDAESYPSLLFTYWEQVAIEDARRSRGMNRAPTDAELMRDLKSDDDGERVKPPPESRNIALSGIAYKAKESWTIWLNGKRVTPTAIPEEALDLKVFKEYIEIKWYDEYTNRIIPIRLRPHQRFNIDTRIFLPG